MKQFQTIIIGAGAAGLMAAIISARNHSNNGQDILIIEKNKVIGRKILVTGNGRCNLTNTNISPDRYYGTNTKGLLNIFSRFSSRETMDFFEELGVRLKTEERGRVFPVTNQASTIVDLLIEELNRLKINIQLEESVTGLSRCNIGVYEMWKVTTDKSVYTAKYVVIAAGGKSYPQLGSTGDGYNLAQKLGHRIIEPKPALVPLELEEHWFHKLQGVKTEVELIIKEGGKIIASNKEELIFTHYGISGPAVLDISRLVVDYSRKPGVTIAINFFPGYDAESLQRFLTERWKAHTQKTLFNSLLGVMPKKLCKVLITELKIDGDKTVSHITKKELATLAENLTGWVIKVKRPRPFAESMVTAGGVSLDEVNARTMESLKAKGIYLAGEVLDIDGISGGYNLQFAWSTGYLAGLQI
jgi:predicted Rossmann fold flavoprotein